MSLIFTVFKLTVLIGIVMTATLFAWSYLSPCVYRSKLQAIDKIKESFDSGENYALICVCLMAVYYFGGIACTCLLAGGLYLLDMHNFSSICMSLSCNPACDITEYYSKSN